MPCSDLYLGEDPVYPTENVFEPNRFFQGEFNLTFRQWICPDTRTGNISLHNDPRNYDEGIDFVMVVNRCSVAVANDKLSGAKSYADESLGCKNDTEVTQNLHNF